MNKELKEKLMEMPKEQLISYIDLMLNVIIDLENKNKELKEVINYEDNRFIK